MIIYESYWMIFLLFLIFLIFLLKHALVIASVCWWVDLGGSKGAALAKVYRGNPPLSPIERLGLGLELTSNLN